MTERLAFSGWMASGKDTVAEEVMRRLGCTDAVRMSYAQPIRAEVRRILELLPTGATHQEIATLMGCLPDDISRIHEMLRTDLEENPDLGPDDRTAGMRAALQHWGTDVRRAADEQYWVRASLAEAERHAEAGRGVYYTDLRFPNEVSALLQAGYFTVRIDITRETQRRRLEERDSLIGGAALLHPSETALDYHPSFHLRVRNDHDLEETVSAVLAGYEDWVRRRELLGRSRARKP